MSELSLVYPMLALVLLTCGVLIVLFRSRVRWFAKAWPR
jgi:hypothetical protein